MQGTLSLKTAPAEEPITAAEAKSHMKVDITDDDTYIGTLITAARRKIENHTGARLVSQTWYWYLDEFPAESVLKIPIGPVSALTSITYTSSAGVAATFAAASYQADFASVPARVALNSGYSWPNTSLREINGVCLEFVAGFGVASAVPAELKHAVKLLVAHWYENREPEQPVDLNTIPHGIMRLLDDYRMWQR